MLQYKPAHNLQIQLITEDDREYFFFFKYILIVFKFTNPKLKYFYLNSYLNIFKFFYNFYSF